MYKNYCKLRDLKGLKDADIVRGTGITKSTFSDWKNGRSTPKQSKLQKIADYFEVTVDYLLTGESKEDEANSDIERTLEEMLSKLERQQTGLMYHGEPIDDTTRELLYQSLQNASNWAKKQNELDKK